MKRLPQMLVGKVAPTKGAPTAVRMSAAGLCLGLLYLTLGIAAAAHADVRYTTETLMGGSAGDAGSNPDKKDPKDKNDGEAAKMPTLRTTTFVHGKQQRVETAMEIGPVKSSTITLTLCDTRRIITMDPDLKLYTVARMDGASSAAATTGAALDKLEESKSSGKKADTGHLITTYNIQDLGKEKVNDINARHFMVTMRIERSGCAGKGDSTMKMETWVASGQLGGLDCEERVPTTVPRTLANESGCQITCETKGDTALLGEVFRGIVVRQRIYNGDKVAMTQEVKNITSDPLSAALFTPPADYREVTSKEYAEAKRKAMMASFNMPSGIGQAGATGSVASETGAAGTAPGTAAGTSAPPPPPAKRRRGGLGGSLGGSLGGALGGALGGRVPGVGNVLSLGSLGGNILSVLGGERGLGGIAHLLGSGMLGMPGGYSPITLPGLAGDALSVLGSLPSK